MVLKHQLRPTLKSPGRPKKGRIPSEDLEDRIRRALGKYEETLRTQRDGDWARYGEAIRRLGDILKQ